MIHPYNYVTAKEAFSVIESGMRVFIHGSVCTPTYLLNELFYMNWVKKKTGSEM